MTETRITRDRLETLLRKMATTKVVVVGDAMLDVYLVGEVDRGASQGDLDVAPAGQRLDCREQIAGAAAAVLVVDSAASSPEPSW